jgi:hypothetical protein
MKNFSRFFLAVFFVSSLSSCAFLDRFNKAPELDFLDRGSKIDLKKFFNGEIEAFAITQDENGKISGTQTAKISGKWDENKGVIQQNFIYADGTKDSRTWLITINSDGTFDAVGHDVTSPAKGKQSGNAAQMIYSLSLAGKDGKQEVKFEDKMYLVDDKSMIMISNFKRGYSSSGKSIFSLKKIN